MTKREKIVVWVLALSFLFLTGCGLNIKVPENNFFVKNESENDVEMIEEKLEIEEPSDEQLTIEEIIHMAKESGRYLPEEIRMLELEYEKSTDGLSREEYDELINIYEKLDLHRLERDTIEEVYKLSFDEKYIDRLNDVYIDVTEADETAGAIIGIMENYLKEGLNTGDYSKAIRLLLSEEWTEAVNPFVREGYRNYILADNEDVKLIVREGYSKTGSRLARIYYAGKTKENNAAAVLWLEDDTLSLYCEESAEAISLTDILSDTGTKKFVYTVIDGSKGLVDIQEGNLNKGAYSGEYTAKALSGDAGNIYELYINIEQLKGEIFKGEFDENGISKVEKPSESNLASFAKSEGTETVVVYAYNDKKNKCLYKGATKQEAKEGISFNVALLDIEKAPDVKKYETKSKLELADLYSKEEKLVAESAIKVRIYNGRIELFDGISWVDYGTVESLADEDPFGEADKIIADKMKEERLAAADAARSSDDILSVGNITVQRTQATVANSNKTSTKQQTQITQQPQQNQVTQQPQQTQQVTSPQPAQNTPEAPAGGDSSSGSQADNTSSGGGSDQGGNSSSSESGGNNDNSGSSDSSGSTSSGDDNDVVIPWVPDMK